MLSGLWRFLKNKENRKTVGERKIKMEDRAKKILVACAQEKSKNPVEIFCNVAKQDFVRIHGPEHHVLDGAALLTAYYNAGGQIDLQTSLEDPTGKSDDAFKIVIKEIERRILQLKAEIAEGLC